MYVAWLLTVVALSLTIGAATARAQVVDVNEGPATGWNVTIELVTDWAHYGVWTKPYTFLVAVPPAG